MAIAGTFPENEVHIVAAQMEHPPWFTAEEKSPTRLARAVRLLEEQKVAGENGVYHVSGNRKVYTVTTEGCDCEAATKGGDTYCYHRVAAQLYARLQQRLGQGTGFHAPAVPQEDQDAAPPDLAQMTPKGVCAPGVPLRAIRAIVADLSRPLPEECVATREQAGQTIRYLHWYDVALLLNTYAPGWSGAVVDQKEWSREELVVRRGGPKTGELATVHICTVTYRLSIPCLEGIISREQTGRETAETIPYGDWSSNATAMAFTRAASMFGVGMWLRDRTEKPTSAALRKHLTSQAWGTLGTVCDQHGYERDVVKEQLLRHAGTNEPGRVSLESLWMFLENLPKENI